MGEFGSWVIARQEEELGSSAAVTRVSESVEGEQRLDGGWRCAFFGDEEVVAAAAELVVELGRSTGAPAMTVFSFDAEAFEVCGWSEPTGVFRAAMPWSGRELLAGEVDEDPDELFLRGGDAVERCERWAVAGGLSPDAAELRRLLDDHDTEVSDVVPLLQALGLVVPAGPQAD